MSAASLTISSLPETADRPVLVVPKAHQPISRQAVPIIDIIHGLSPSPQKVHFCYMVLDRTLSSLINHQYSNFDAHTTSNCCHGMALLVRELILLASKEDLAQMHRTVRERLDNGTEDPSWRLPKALIKLSQLYILRYILEITPKGTRSAHKKLLNITTIDVKFCDKLVGKLQKHYGNMVALRYEYYLNQVSGKIKTCDVLIDLWGKYASRAYLRSDKRGLHYTSSLYSMQVVLAYLIHSKAKIAIVNDIIDKTGKVNRYLRILQGDGTGNFSILELDRYKDRKFINEPVFVFGGCAKTENPDQTVSRLDDWICRFPNLVLAHEVTYPQFPKVNEEFQSHAIIPEEEILQDLIIEHSKTTGLSAKDPSFFYLNHIYTSSLQQMLHQSDSGDNLLSFNLLSLRIHS